MKRRGKPYYKALGVPKDATPGQVKRAYRDLAKQLHPDRVSDPEQARRAEDRLKEINAAWNEYQTVLRLGGESSTAGPQPGRGPAPPKRTEEDEESETSSGPPRAARGREATSTRNRYRAERAREAREREARERQAREQAEAVRRERDAELYARLVVERGERVRLVRVTLAVAAALVAVFVAGFLLLVWLLG